MYRKLVFVLTMLAVAFGSISQAQGALASPRQPARVASAAHAWTAASIAKHSPTGPAGAAAASRQTAHRPRLRTGGEQGSLPLSSGRRTTKTASAPRSPGPPPWPRLSTPATAPPSPRTLAACVITSAASTTFTVGQAGTFTVTSTGSPTCTLSDDRRGHCRRGVTFTGPTGTARRHCREHRLRARRHVHVHDHRHERCPVLPPPRPSPSRSTRRVRSPALALPPPLPSACPGPLPSRRPGRPRAHCPRRPARPNRTAVGSHVHGQRGRHGDTFGNTGCGTAAYYTFTITATNGVGPDATQTFTLTVNPQRGV